MAIVVWLTGPGDVAKGPGSEVEILLNTQNKSTHSKSLHL